MNMYTILILCRWLGSSRRVFGCRMTVLAISPADLQQKLSAGEKLTLVSTCGPPRSSSRATYPTRSTCPPPWFRIKQLPPLGRVVVYDDGLGPDTASVAAAALNQKAGITADVAGRRLRRLGIGAVPDHSAAGPRIRRNFLMITYERLKRVPGENLVLVDLRETPHAVASAKALSGTATPALTDLQAEFPATRITRSALETAGAKTASLAGVSAARSAPLLVLIDSGNGAAQQMARTLKANGVKRFVILAGGEETLAHKGRSGRRRTTATVSAPTTAPPQVTITNR
jgi:rhodanese-related sulfurtransferase